MILIKISPIWYIYLLNIRSEVKPLENGKPYNVFEPYVRINEPWNKRAA